MADRYLDSGASSTGSPYESTSTAALTLVTFDALALAVNETIWVKNTHSFTATTAQTFTSSANATAANPQRVICVSDFGTNATPVTTPSAIEQCSANVIMAFEGFWHLHGLVFNQSNVGTSANISLGANTAGPHAISASVCKFSPQPTTGTTAGALFIGNIGNASNDETQIELTDCQYEPAHANNFIGLGHGQIRITNLSFTGANNPVSVFKGRASVTFDCIVQDSDLTGLTPTNLFDSSGATSGVFVVRNVKLPSGTVLCTDGITAPGMRFVADEMTIGTTYVPFYRRYFSGQVWHEPTIKSNDTADRLYLISDADGYSIKLEGSANSTYWQPLYSDWIHIPIDDTTTAITPYAEILALGDGATALSNRECWLEVDVKTVAGTNNHQATRYNDAANLVTSGTDQAAGTISWTGHGYTTPRTHKLALGSSVTPTQKGFIRVRVALAKNTSIFIGKVGVA